MTTNKRHMAAYRAAAVQCVLHFSEPSLELNNEYLLLETAEKSSLSYWIGMTMTAIAANDLLQVHKTVHASKVKARIKRVSRRTKSLADLIGMDIVGSWHVMEAKGQQKTPSALDRANWKAQARTIRPIDNKMA